MYMYIIEEWKSGERMFNFKANNIHAYNNIICNMYINMHIKNPKHRRLIYII